MNYYHLPQPPRAIRQLTIGRPMSASLIDTADRYTEEYPIYCRQHIDANGCQTTQVLSLTEYLWHVIQQHCRHSCHNLHLTLRGSLKLTIHSGNHDSKVWTYHAETWEHLIYKATMDFLPGYWTPPWITLRSLSSDPIGQRIAALIPGESLAIDHASFPKENPMTAFIASMNETMPTYIEQLLESISGSAYHLVIRPTTDQYWHRNVTIVQRLQHSLEGNTSRAYVSPDRRHHYTQDPKTGLYHFKE